MGTKNRLEEMGKWTKEQGTVEDRCRISGIGPFPDTPRG